MGSHHRWIPANAIHFLVLTTLLLLPHVHCRRAGVTIYNLAAGNIYLHCASADDEILKDAVALPEGQKVSWTFKPKLFGRTLYWCSFRWIDPSTAIKYRNRFTVWSMGLVNYYHQHDYFQARVQWNVTASGFSFSVDNGTVNLHHEWIKSK